MRETPSLTPTRQAERAARDKRLAEALRENLRRRKEQARARADKQPDDPTVEPGPANDSAER
jgi:hypothetical protein